MSQEQIRRLGHYLRAEREAKGLSQRQLSIRCGVDSTTILRIERGDFAVPQPDKLRAIAQALDLPLRDVWSMAGYELDDRLPAPMPFLRAKYRDLTPQALEALSSDVAEVLKRHGIDPNGRPADGEDEIVEEAA